MRATRRGALGLLAAAVSGVGGCVGGAASTVDTGQRGTDPASLPELRLYRPPDCGRCSGYVEYLERQDVDPTVETLPQADLEAVKDDRSVPESLRSTHTAEIGEYVVEGPVPLEAVGTLVGTDASIDGIAVPETPEGAPGGDARGEPLAVYAFRTDGGTSLFLELEGPWG
jgi:hypothetical protein